MEENKSAPEFQTGSDKPSFSEASLDRELVFHYSRERRLAKVSPELRAFIEQGQQKRSLLGSLTATRSHTILLITIIVINAIIFGLSIKNKTKDSVTLRGNSISISAERIEETAYLTIRKTAAKNAQVYTGIVDVAVSPTDSSAVATHQIRFTGKTREEYGLTIPFEAASALVVALQIKGEARKVFTVKLK